MKKILLILPMLFTLNFAFATIDCTKNGFTGTCGSDGYFSPNDSQKYKDYLVNQIRQKFSTYIGDIAHPDNVVSYAEKTTAEIQSLIKEYKSLGTVSENQETCVGISNKLWIGKIDSNTNGDVTRVQKFLKKIGVIDWDSDGRFGTWDKAAVWKFQQNYMPNISPTGDIGSLTMAKINSMICGYSTAKATASWTFGGNAPDGANKSATVSIKLPDGSSRSGSFLVRNDCVQTTSEYTGKNSRPPQSALNSWLTCESWSVFTSYYVVYENGKYIVKTRPEDMSGLNRDTTSVVKEL